VIIIIGILAAIALPVFFEQREKAWDAAVQSNLRNAAAAATSCSADNNGSYLNCGTEAILDGFGYNEDPNVDLTIDTFTDTEWAASAFYDGDGDNNMDGDTDYSFTTNTGVVTETP
jgi:type IV pilus assembly protein PilA